MLVPNLLAPGIDGVPGTNGKPGEELVFEEVHPPYKPYLFFFIRSGLGIQCPMGPPGIDGVPGKRGLPGPDGEDGVQ